MEERKKDKIIFNIEVNEVIDGVLYMLDDAKMVAMSAIREQLANKYLHTIK